MKSEALQYLESRLALGHINIQEFSVLHQLLALFNRLLKLVKRTYSGEIELRCASKLIAEEASDARRHLSSFHRLYSHTAVECQSVASSRHVFDPSNSRDRRKVEEIRVEFKNDIERLPGTRELFELISANFDDNIYHPFLESHRRNPAHRIWDLEPELTSTCIAIVELYSLVCEAEDWAGQIDKKLAEFRRTCDEHGEGLALRHGNDASLPIFAESPAIPHTRSEVALSRNMMCKNVSYDTPSHPYGVGRSFSAFEEAVNQRPATTKENYIAQDAEETATIRPRVSSISRRNGHVFPRVFTGSFSELEESTRELRIPKPEGFPLLLQTAVTESNETVELVTTPLSSATPIPSVAHTPSPGQLRRREALIEHDGAYTEEWKAKSVSRGLLKR